jgi:hypothetical protein
LSGPITESPTIVTTARMQRSDRAPTLEIAAKLAKPKQIE